MTTIIDNIHHPDDSPGIEKPTVENVLNPKLNSKSDTIVNQYTSQPTSKIVYCYVSLHTHSEGYILMNESRNSFNLKIHINSEVSQTYTRTAVWKNRHAKYIIPQEKKAKILNTKYIKYRRSKKHNYVFKCNLMHNLSHSESHATLHSFKPTFYLRAIPQSTPPPPTSSIHIFQLCTSADGVLLPFSPCCSLMFSCSTRPLIPLYLCCFLVWNTSL